MSPVENTMAKKGIYLPGSPLKRRAFYGALPFEHRQTDPRPAVRQDMHSYIAGMSPKVKEKLALSMIAKKYKDSPNGTNIRMPAWFPGKVRVWRKDDKTGVLRPRRMMDDMLDAKANK